MVYDVMGIGGTVKPEEYKALIDKWLGWPLRWIIDMRFLDQGCCCEHVNNGS